MICHPLLYAIILSICFLCEFITLFIGLIITNYIGVIPYQPTQCIVNRINNTTNVEYLVNVINNPCDNTLQYVSLNTSHINVNYQLDDTLNCYTNCKNVTIFPYYDNNVDTISRFCLTFFAIFSLTGCVTVIIKYIEDCSQKKKNDNPAPVPEHARRHSNRRNRRSRKTSVQ